MNRFLMTVAIVATSASTAFAQAPVARPATPATSAPAATTAPASAVTTAARPIAGTVARGAAETKEAALRAAADKVNARQSNCTAKGRMYVWKPPHVAGDANPKGGFYTSNYAGGCMLMSLKDALASGAVRTN
jgi:hypothetical protein